MWRNYMTVGVRALVKNKTYAFINIFGLAIGLAACLMLLLYVRYETTYDQWLPNAENTLPVPDPLSGQADRPDRRPANDLLCDRRAAQERFPADRAAWSTR